MRGVGAVNTGMDLVVLEDGEIIPIVVYFDEDGDEVDGDDAVSCVAGPDVLGKWWAIKLEAGPCVTIH